MRLDLIESSLAFLSLIGLVAFGSATFALAILAVLWPFGISPDSHPLLWRSDLTALLASLGCMLIPYLLARLVRAIEPKFK